MNIIIFLYDKQKRVATTCFFFSKKTVATYYDLGFNSGVPSVFSQNGRLVEGVRPSEVHKYAFEYDRKNSIIRWYLDCKLVREEFNVGTLPPRQEGDIVLDLEGPAVQIDPDHGMLILAAGSTNLDAGGLWDLNSEGISASYTNNVPLARIYPENLYAPLGPVPFAGYSSVELCSVKIKKKCAPELVEEEIVPQL